MNQPIQAQTDQEYTVQLDSAIVYVCWNSCRATGGTTAEIDVRTAYVGEGAQIQIRIEGEQSGSLGGVDDVLFGNRYFADIPIPDSVQVDEKIWFTATLPRHRLSEQSEKIPVVVPIRMVSIQWGQQEARRGDVVDIRAEFIGLQDTVACEVHILEYDADGNHDPINRIPSEIRNGRLNLQWEYEYHEDTDEIPTEEELQEYGSHYNPPEYFFVVEIDGLRIGNNQESGILEFKDWLHIQAMNNFGKLPLQYIARLADGNRIQSQLQCDGTAKILNVCPGPVLLEYF